MCTAMNAWSVDHWLDRDDRLYSVILVPSSNPEAAVAEIKRHGQHPKMVAVLLAANPLGRPFGHPVYHDIYQAAADNGLSVSVHVSLASPANVKTIGGLGNTHIEKDLQFTAQGMHYLSSFIFHGVFEKFPSLKVVIKEFGVSWLPHFVWKLDESYDLLRLESPWVKRRPSEYIRDNVRFSTQPVEAGRIDAARWGELMATLEGAEDLLCFSSDYPHYTFDDPFQIAQILPDAWVAKVMSENACRTYGWDLAKDPSKVVPLEPSRA